MYFVLFNTDDRHYYHATDYVAEALGDASVYDSSVLAQNMADVLQEGNNRVEWIVVPVNDGHIVGKTLQRADDGKSCRRVECLAYLG